MSRHVITFLLLILAITFYGFGAAGPGTVFLILGVLSESAFWYRVFTARKKTDQ